MENNLATLLLAGDLDPQLRAIVAQLGRLSNQVQQLRGSFEVEAGGQLLHLTLFDTDWHELPGLDGIYLKALPELGHGPHHDVDYVAVRGLQGARSPRVRNPRRQRIHVQVGSILLSRQGGPYLPYGPGSLIELDYEEEHGFLAREEFYLLNAYHPRLTTDPQV